LEPPSQAAPDIAFTLIIFFIVCASVQPDTGKPQDIPQSEEEPEEEEQTQNIEVSISESSVTVNSEAAPVNQLATKIKQLLAGKKKEGDRVVLIKSSSDTTYQRWITVTTAIEEGGGIITLQLEQKKTITVD